MLPKGPLQGLAILLLLSAGCGATASVEDSLRSQKEYELAAGLVGEKNMAGAFEHLFKSLELDAQNVDAHLLLGNLYLFRGDLDKAEASLRQARKLAGGLEEYGPPKVAEVENSLGVVLMHQERYDEAIEVLRGSSGNLLNRQPHLSWGNLGWAYYEKGEYADALRALDQAVRAQGKFCLGYYRMGRTYLALQQHENAEASFTRALEVDDEACQQLQDAWHLRGEARAQLGHRQDAIEDFERCVELSADSEAGRACQGYLEATH